MFTPQDPINESFSRCRNQDQIQICIPACLMAVNFFYDNFSVFSQVEKSLNG